MKVISITYRREGLGTTIQQVIHAAIDRTPLSARTKAAIKGCTGCGRRVVFLNRADAAVRAALGQNPVAPAAASDQNPGNNPPYATDANPGNEVPQQQHTEGRQS